MKRVLMLSFRPPYPLTEGFKLRAYHLARLLARRCRLDLLTLQDRPLLPPEAAKLEEVFGRVVCFSHSRRWARLRAVGMLPTRQPLQVGFYRSAPAHRWLQAHQEEYDLFWGFHLRMAPYLERVAAPKVIDLIDAASLFYRGAHRYSAGVWRWLYGLESRRALAYEGRILRTFDRAFVTSSRDAAHLQRQLKATGSELDTRLRVLPNGVREELLRAPPAGQEVEHRLVFLGKMDYAPNVDAVLYFTQEIFPRLKERRPALEFWVVGTAPRPEVWALGSRPGVRVTGHLDDPFALVRGACLVVTPLRYGAGIQNKNLEAMALGKPVVTTPAGALGIAGQDGVHFRVVCSQREWVQTVHELLEDEPQRRALGRRARELIRTRYRWDQVGQQLVAELRGLL